MLVLPQFTRFMMMRAENFVILRRRPIKGYDISFLITHRNAEDMMKHKLVDFVIQCVPTSRLGSQSLHSCCTCLTGCPFALWTGSWKMSTEKSAR